MGGARFSCFNLVLNQGVRIGPTYATLGVTRAVSPAAAFCRLTRTLRTSFTCAVAALALKNTVSGLHHRQGLTKSDNTGSDNAGF
jgi:hypothetical protein